jgi:hypothetical protein
MSDIPAVLSDYDLLELVVFASKVESEGYDYAAEEYAPDFEFNDFARIDRDELDHIWRTHRSAVDAWWAAHPDDGVDLHNAHVDASRKRLSDRCLWGVRYDHGGESACDSEAEARFLVDHPSWRARWLLHRDQPGGEWAIVDDTAGREYDSEVRWLKVGDSVLLDDVWLEVVSDAVEVRDMRATGRSARTHVRVFTLSDGRKVDTEAPSVRMRRRTADPATLAN